MNRSSIVAYFALERISKRANSKKFEYFIGALGREFAEEKKSYDGEVCNVLF